MRYPAKLFVREGFYDCSAYKNFIMNKFIVLL